jgi:hypothetical protein
MSFAVESNGSLWFIDARKNRLAHFSAGGAFLEEVPGVEFNRFDPLPQDLAVVGDQVFFMRRAHQSWESLIDPVTGGRLGTAITAASRGGPIVVRNLLTSQSSLVGDVQGFAEGHGHELGERGPEGFGRIDASTGAVRFLPGAPLGDGVFMKIGFGYSPGGGLEVWTYRGPSLTVLPIKLRLVAEQGGHRVRVPGGASIERGVVVPHGIAVYFHVGPRNTSDAHFGDGRWVLEVFDDGRPIVWERVREPGLSDENLIRHLSATPDGTLYLMLPDRHGVAIYRR